MIVDRSHRSIGSHRLAFAGELKQKKLDRRYVERASESRAVEWVATRGLGEKKMKKKIWLEDRCGRSALNRVRAFLREFGARLCYWGQPGPPSTLLWLCPFVPTPLRATHLSHPASRSHQNSERDILSSLFPTRQFHPLLPSHPVSPFHPLFSFHDRVLHPFFIDLSPASISPAQLHYNTLSTVSSFIPLVSAVDYPTLSPVATCRVTYPYRSLSFHSHHLLPSSFTFVLAPFSSARYVFISLSLSLSSPYHRSPVFLFLLFVLLSRFSSSCCLRPVSPATHPSVFLQPSLCRANNPFL